MFCASKLGRPRADRLRIVLNYIIGLKQAMDKHFNMAGYIDNFGREIICRPHIRFRAGDWRYLYIERLLIHVNKHPNFMARGITQSLLSRTLMRF
jgi:hypothetical protein